MQTTKEYLRDHMGHRRTELHVSLNSLQPVVKDIITAFAGEHPDHDAHWHLHKLNENLKSALEASLRYSEAGFAASVAYQLEEKHD